jgi:hypothetical protein
MHAAVKAALAGAAHMDGAFDKLFVKYQLPEFPSRLLPPYRGATEEQFLHFRETCRAALAAVPAAAGG